MNRTIAAVIICLTLIASAYSVETAQTDKDQEVPNMYERIETLIDSLMVWSQVVTKDSISTTIEDFNIDSTILTEWFPGSTVKVDDSLKTALISYPKYLDLFTTELQFDYVDKTIDSNKVLWSVSLKFTDQGIFLDGLIIPTPENIVWDEELKNLLQNRLTALRTIGLPTGSVAVWQAGLEDEFGVTIRGRDIIELPYFQENLMFALRQITLGMQVYAGLLSLSGNNDTLNMDYYLLITFPGAQGHHFIELTEQMTNDAEGWKTTDIEVIFTPYIRTDNLKNLFAIPNSKQPVPVELKIR
ncbi:MAG: hypothetical protein P9X24_18405 [Candidatus Hatepunaea meridiana]|nr:hypothetical protein [Candidatus Hatepunaea meridiana]